MPFAQHAPGSKFLAVSNTYLVPCDGSQLRCDAIQPEQSVSLCRNLQQES